MVNKTKSNTKMLIKKRGMNGVETTSVIYATVGKEDGARPEFTEVVRQGATAPVLIVI